MATILRRNHALIDVYVDAWRLWRTWVKIAKMFWSIVAISKNILPNAARNIALADFVARLNCAAPPAKHNIL